MAGGESARKGGGSVRGGVTTERRMTKKKGTPNNRPD